MIVLAILLLRHRLPSGGGRRGGGGVGPQQFSMFDRKMPCETIVPGR